MKTSILVMAAVAAVATFAQAPAAEAGGFRIGFGFGVPFGARLGLADPSILQRATEANERVKVRERAALYGGSSAAAAKSSMRREQAEQARLAKRPVGIAAAGKAETAPVAVISGDRQPDAAQQQKKAKAEDASKGLAKTALKTAAPIVTPVRQAGSDATPFDTGAAVAPTMVKQVSPAATAVPAKEASAGECLRYIAGAGVTIKVSCSE